MKTPAVRLSHNQCASPHGSIAKGATKMKVVGTLTYSVTAWRAWMVSDARSPPSAR